MVVDALSRPNQVIGAEWNLHQEVFDCLRKRWPVTIDLCAASLNHICGVYFVLVSDPMAAGTDTMLQSWDFLQAYAFPPFTLIPQLLVKLWSSPGTVLTLIAPVLAAEEMVSRSSRSPSEAPFASPGRWVLLYQLHVQRLHQTLPVFRLHAWQLSSASLSEPLASLQKWLEVLTAPVDHLL